MKYPYILVRTPKRKTLSILIRPDLTVEVRVPQRTSQKAVEQFVERNLGWIEEHLAKQKERNMAARTITPEEEQAMRRQAKEYLPGRIAYYSARMGVTPTGFRVTGARTRFGSCSGKDSLNFSFRLMAYPPEAIDYVVVHELAHIRHKDHSPAFYRFIAQVMPDYKVRNAILKDPQYRIL